MQPFKSAHAALARAQLARPTALVLAGPQGCGKSILARMLASERGTFTETVVSQLLSKDRLSQLLTNLPRTVVINDNFQLARILGDERYSAALRQMVTSGRQVINERGVMRSVPTPKLIFCTCDLDYFARTDIGPRFSVVNMGVQGGAA